MQIGLVVLNWLSEDKRNRVESIIARARKNKAISLRIAEYDLEKLKEKAKTMGYPIRH